VASTGASPEDPVRPELVRDRETERPDTRQLDPSPVSPCSRVSGKEGGGVSGVTPFTGVAVLLDGRKEDIWIVLSGFHSGYLDKLIHFPISRNRIHRNDLRRHALHHSGSGG
jgi:hypothetical protein